MLDKIELRVPFNVGYRPGFQFMPRVLRYADTTSPIRASQYYAGVCDLRPFRLDALLHVNFKGRGPQNHKLELLHSGGKSLRQMSQIIESVFDIDPCDLRLMRIDFAADLDGIPVTHLYDSLRVKYKRSADAIGELDYETVGRRRLEYFRYGRSPNCLRVYDKPAECMARFRGLLKLSNPDAEPPTFEDLFGFSPDTVRSRVERQSGGGRIPEVLSTFGQLKNAAEFNPFSDVEITPSSFPFPDPRQCGAAHGVKLAGIQSFVQKFGYQQARAALNCDRNAKRMMDEYKSYIKDSSASTELTVDSIMDSYRRSVTKQIDGSIEAGPQRH